MATPIIRDNENIVRQPIVDENINSNKYDLLLKYQGTFSPTDYVYVYDNVSKLIDILGNAIWTVKNVIGELTEKVQPPTSMSATNKINNIITYRKNYFEASVVWETDIRTLAEFIQTKIVEYNNIASEITNKAEIEGYTDMELYVTDSKQRLAKQSGIQISLNKAREKLSKLSSKINSSYVTLTNSINGFLSTFSFPSRRKVYSFNQLVDMIVEVNSSDHLQQLIDDISESVSKKTINREYKGSRAPDIPAIGDFTDNIKRDIINKVGNALNSMSSLNQSKVDANTINYPSIEFKTFVTTTHGEAFLDRLIKVVLLIVNCVYPVPYTKMSDLTSQLIQLGTSNAEAYKLFRTFIPSRQNFTAFLQSALNYIKVNDVNGVWVKSNNISNTIKAKKLLSKYYTSDILNYLQIINDEETLNYIRSQLKKNENNDDEYIIYYEYFLTHFLNNQSPPRDDDSNSGSPSTSNNNSQSPPNNPQPEDMDVEDEEDEDDTTRSSTNSNETTRHSSERDTDSQTNNPPLLNPDQNLFNNTNGSVNDNTQSFHGYVPPNINYENVSYDSVYKHSSVLGNDDLRGYDITKFSSDFMFKILYKTVKDITIKEGKTDKLYPNSLEMEYNYNFDNGDVDRVRHWSDNRTREVLKTIPDITNYTLSTYIRNLFRKLVYDIDKDYIDKAINYLISVGYYENIASTNALKYTIAMIYRNDSRFLYNNITATDDIDGTASKGRTVFKELNESVMQGNKMSFEEYQAKLNAAAQIDFHDYDTPLLSGEMEMESEA